MIVIHSHQEMHYIESNLREYPFLCRVKYLQVLCLCEDAVYARYYLNELVKDIQEAKKGFFSISETEMTLFLIWAI